MLIIVAAASAVSWIMIEEHADQVLGVVFVPFHSSPRITIVVIIFMTILLGMIMEDTSILVLMTQFWRRLRRASVSTRCISESPGCSPS